MRPISDLTKEIPSLNALVSSMRPSLEALKMDIDDFYWDDTTETLSGSIEISPTHLTVGERLNSGVALFAAEAAAQLAGACLNAPYKQLCLTTVIERSKFNTENVSFSPGDSVSIKAITGHSLLIQMETGGRTLLTTNFVMVTTSAY
jgi:hypothetical protein